ncbi:neuronal acetylcholine receptor subunit alpha-4-like [Pecten maximus]|uniref:neuronal acetylcholine receptor subunit alpha-4-like n=1 Tax=Pecten maximus TaxID=6579 RepID=UPI0014585535|nr:neuronal acetylcholine receptor subunit alpha-4-like [Pecten maximus]
MVSWKPGGLLKVKCDPDVSNFPFDEQSCTVVLTPWGYDKSKVILHSSSSGMDKSYFEKNGEWTVTDTSVSSDTVSAQSVLKFDITIKRKSTFHGLNTIAPMVILLVLNPLVFILPPQSEERINFSVTLLLSYVVLLTVLTGVLPTNSKPMAAINYTMITTLCLSTRSFLDGVPESASVPSDSVYKERTRSFLDGVPESASVPSDSVYKERSK